MMTPLDFPHVPSDLMPALEAALGRHDGAKAKLADFKKEYNAVKAKVKRLEKEMAAMDLVEDRFLFNFMNNTVQLAVNKFVPIDKKLMRFQQEPERYCKDSLKALRSSNGMERNMTAWHIDGLYRFGHRTDDLLHIVSDMLRIAKWHLKKVDDHKKYVRKLARNRHLWLGRP
jgi:hypothetical protein